MAVGAAVGGLEQQADHNRHSLIFGALVVAAGLRLAAVVGQRAFIYFDSIDYETLDFSGGSRRPWVTPLLYSITDDASWRILLQALLGIVCWSVLAVQAGALAKDGRVQAGLVAAVLGLSLTTTVTNWDTAMLSESLALSLTALLLGSLLHLARVRSRAAVGFVLGAWLLWIFCRQSHLVLAGLGIVAVLVVLGVGWVRQRRVDRLLAALGGGLLVLTSLAALSYGQNTEIVQFNLAQVLGNRVFTDPSKLAWFVDHGMPQPDGTAPGAAVGVEQLLADRAFERWIETDARATYARYLLADPWNTVTAPLDSLMSSPAPFGDPERQDEALLGGPEPYGVSREVIPGAIEDLLFDPGRAGAVVFALVVVLALTGRRWSSRGPDGRWSVPLILLVLQWPALTAVWHASTAELGRLALPSVVVIRVALLVQIALLVDAWLADRRAGATPSEPIRTGGSTGSL